MPVVNVTETAPDGTKRTYAENVTGSSRDEIDIYGSIVCSRILASKRGEITPLNAGQVTKDAMDEAAKWSQENEKLIDEAVVLGHEGEAVVNWVIAMNSKCVRESGMPPDEIHAQEAQEVYAEEAPNPAIEPAPQYTIEPLTQSYERAKILAFWLRAQMREAVDDLTERDNKMLAEIIGPDCKLVSKFEFNLNYVEEKQTDVETEIPNPSDSRTT